MTLLKFARIFDVRPDEIRDDLPEQIKIKKAKPRWPFSIIKEHEWFALSDIEKGMAESAARHEIDEIKQARSIVAPAQKGARRTLQRTSR